jgi:predicted P-loop ATPase
MKIKVLHVSLLQNHLAYASKPVSIDEVYRLIRHDNVVKQLTIAYRNLARTVSRKVANSDVKERQMPVFSVAVLFNGAGKQMSHIVEFTGLCFCDIDHVKDVEEAFYKCKNDPHTFMVYHTISGEGLRVIYSYQRADGNPHLNAVPYAAAYLKGNAYYSQLVGTEFDKGCGNVNRLSGLAHDPEVYLNTQATPFVVNDDEMLDESFTTGWESGKPRKEYGKGSQKAVPEEVWPIVQQMMSRREITYGAGSHHDFVLHATYVFNRFGCTLDELLQWAAQEWADYNKDERERCIKWVYNKKMALHGTWKNKQPGKKGKQTPISIEEICTWFIQNKVELMYNMVTDQTFYRNFKSNGWQQVSTLVHNSLRCTIAKQTGKLVSRQDVADVIQSDFAKLVHPVRDYLDNLPVWDGIDRVAELAAHIEAVPISDNQTYEEAQEYKLWTIHKWLAASVASWTTDGQANQTIFTLIGPQGIYKTTFFRFLLPPSLRSYFYENTRNSFSTKDDHIALAENCFVEIEEVGVSRERDLSELKSLATSVKVKERKPYGRFAEERHRLASLCATGNTDEFLTDETGNRRWLCVKVSRIDDPHEWRLDYDQLYSQLRYELVHGFRHYFDYAEQERVEEQNKYFKVVSDEEQLITMRFRKPKPNDTSIKLLRPAAIAQMISYGRPPMSTRKVGQVLRKLGFKWSHTKSGSVYHVFEISPSEVNASLSAQVYDNNIENQKKTYDSLASS